MSDDVILIAYDGSDNAVRAIEYAGRFLTARTAVVVTAWEPAVRQAARMSGMTGMIAPHEMATDSPDVALTDAEAINTEGVDAARRVGLHAQGRCAEISTTIWAAIIETADQLDVQIIVTGTRGQSGLRSLLQTSVADHVLRRGHRPVLIVPPGN